MIPFEGHPLCDVYVHHLFALAHTALEECDRIRGGFPPLPPEPENFFSPDAALHARLEMVVTSSANIAKLLRVPAHKSKGKSTPAFEWRRMRAIALNKLIDDAPLPELRQTEGRNAVEHFDQFLDQLSVELLPLIGRRPIGARAGYNLVVSRASFAKPPLRPLRMYVIDEETYYAHGESVHFGRLRDDLAVVVAKLTPRVQSGPSMEGPGGIVVLLPSSRRGEQGAKSLTDRPDGV